jgi:transcriptional regulator with XRE-family HTH domain
MAGLQPTLSQAELARLLGAGEPTISRICRGHARPGLDLAAAIERLSLSRVRASAWAEPEEGEG